MAGNTCLVIECGFEYCEKINHTSGNFNILQLREKVVKLVEFWLQVVAVAKLLTLWRKPTTWKDDIYIHIFVQESLYVLYF